MNLSKWALLPVACLSLSAWAEPTWWKGNLHAHSLWSDGDSYPELVVDWYRNNGYHFLVLTEHDILPRGTKWIHPTLNEFARGRGDLTLDHYRERFGTEWVETRVVDDAFREELRRIPDPPPEFTRFARRPPDEHMIAGEELVRLRGLEEFRHLFEEKNHFLLLPGIELSALTAHVNVMNLVQRFPFQRGTDGLAAMEMNLEAALAQSERTGRPVLAQVNHPNYGGAVPAERLAETKAARFFEIYNGHPLVENQGNDALPDTERFWDIVLTLRLAELGLGRIFGLAVDDAHEYDGDTGLDRAAPGRGWVMVRAASLSPDKLMEAMFAGDFYASTGVRLQDVTVTEDQYRVSVAAAPGVTYRTRFIGTRQGYDANRRPIPAADGSSAAWRYSDDVGVVLAEVEGREAVYRFSGDEIYVRAQVVSDRVKSNRGAAAEEWEMAWAQPAIP